jgi:hypothetical protein
MLPGRRATLDSHEAQKIGSDAMTTTDTLRTEGVGRPTRKPSRAGRFRVGVAGWLLAGYAVVVGAIVLTPSPVDRSLRGDLERIIGELHERGLPHFIGYGDVEVVSNMLMFLPIGLLLAIALPHRAWPLVIVIGPLLSAAVEGAQLLLLPARTASVLDIVANGTGALLGAALGILLRILVRHRDRLVLDDVVAGRRGA